MLKEKLKDNKPGILLYGLTPPKENIQESEKHRIASIWRDRIKNVDIDGIVLYDIQDEADRNKDKRPFEFIKTISPELYYKDYLQTKVDAVIYKAVGKYDKNELSSYIKSLDNNAVNVFVGVSSKNTVVKTTLNDAYKMATDNDTFFGGICIPERHATKQDEHIRVCKKSQDGCSFFITQAVYDLEKAKKFIDDYAATDCKKIPIIFTFTPCGSLKTLEFMKWLGISIPYYFEKRLKNSEDILSTSVNLSLELFNFIYKYSLAKGISTGANVESISVKKNEIEASLKLLGDIKEIISKNSVSYRI